MMASPSELSLECKPQSYSMLLKSFAGDHNNSSDIQTTHKLEEYLNRLEEERLKIDAFKRELPLCMQLLTNGIDNEPQYAYKHVILFFLSPFPHFFACFSTLHFEH